MPRNGFSLVEALVAAAVLGIALAIIYRLFLGGLAQGGAASSLALSVQRFSFFLTSLRSDLARVYLLDRATMEISGLSLTEHFLRVSRDGRSVSFRINADAAETSIRIVTYQAGRTPIGRYTIVRTSRPASTGGKSETKRFPDLVFVDVRVSVAAGLAAQDPPFIVFRFDLPAADQRSAMPLHLARGIFPPAGACDAMPVPSGLITDGPAAMNWPLPLEQPAPVRMESLEVPPDCGGG